MTVVLRRDGSFEDVKEHLVTNRNNLEELLLKPEMKIPSRKVRTLLQRLGNYWKPRTGLISAHGRLSNPLVEAFRRK